MINLPFMNTNQATVSRDVPEMNNHVSDEHKASSFESQIKNNETELEQQTVNKVGEADSQNISSGNKMKTSSSSENKEQEVESDEVSTDEPAEAEINADEIIVKKAEATDVDLVALNEAITQIALNIQRTIDDEVVVENINLEGDVAIEQDNQAGTVIELGMLEAAGINIHGTTVQTTSEAHAKTRSVNRESHKDQDLNVEQVFMDDSTAQNGNNNINALSDQESNIGDENSNNTSSNDDKDVDNNEDLLSLESDFKADTSSNISNAATLENLNYFKASDTQEALNLSLKQSQATDPHVIALASKSLLQASDHSATSKIEQAFREISVLSLQNKVPENNSLNAAVDARNVINQVMQNIRGSVGKDSQVVSIRLDPPDWGAIQVKMSMSNNEVNVTLLAENQSVKEALDKSVQALRSQFMQQGLNLGNVNIGVGGGSQDAEREAREQLSEEERKQARKLGSVPKNIARKSGVIRGTEGVVDSHV